MKKHNFTMLDTFNLRKWSFICNNDTLASAVNSLHRVNTIENHMLICQQIIGYLRCMFDMKWIDKNTYLSIVDELHWLKSELKKIESGA